MPSQPCSGCLRPTARPGGWCDRCRPAITRRRHNPRYDRGIYRRAQEAAIVAHVARYGYVCLGRPGHPAHPSRDLTANHPIALAAGGALIQDFEIMCRGLNTAIRPR